MPTLIVQFPQTRDVLIDGVVQGQTNQTIAIAAGSHTLALAGAADYAPAQRDMDISAEAADTPQFVTFTPQAPPLERFSDLYCAYNGFMLGQFLTVMYARYAWNEYPVRRARCQEFLLEIGCKTMLPEQPLEFGSPPYLDLFQQVLQEVAGISTQLSDFAQLSGNFIFYGYLQAQQSLVAAENAGVINKIVERYRLPPVPLPTLVLELGSDGSNRIDDVLSPSLRYLAAALEGFADEPDTAFVIMPFAQPYASYFDTFYRPCLEQAGFRAFRAWGGLSGEDYCDLLLQLIARSGMVWADVSEPNHNVFYEIGAAHAFSKLSVLVRNRDSATPVPANIGHDAVMIYDPGEPDFPARTIQLIGMTIAAMQLAAGRGDRLRIDPQTLEYQIERVAGRLQQQLVPTDAKAAYAEGMRLFRAAELATAESEFTRAIRSGIEIDEAGAHCYLMRGLIRARSGDSESAVADFNRAQQLGEDGFELYFLRGMNHYLLDLYRAAEDDLTQAQTRNPDIADVYLYRGLSRVLRGDYESALQDLDTAQTLGYSGEALYQNRAYAYVRLGRLQEAAKEVETARTLAPESVWTRSASAGLLLAQKRYAEALAELKSALQSEQNASLYFELGLLHLMMLQSGEALQAYAEGLQTARQEVIDVALRELEYWRPHIPPALRAMITEWLDYRID